MAINPIPLMKDFLTQREQDEVALAVHYVNTTNHGTSGHLANNVIAKLSTLLQMHETAQPDSPADDAASLDR